MARVLLFGSRARGDAADDSDWDILVLLPGLVSEARAAAVSRRLYDLEWDTGQVLSVIVRSVEDWDSPRSAMTPFRQIVGREGIAL